MNGKPRSNGSSDYVVLPIDDSGLVTTEFSNFLITKISLALLRDIEFDLESDKLYCLKGLRLQQFGTSARCFTCYTDIRRCALLRQRWHNAIHIIQRRLGDCWLLSALSTLPGLDREIMCRGKLLSASPLPSYRPHAMNSMTKVVVYGFMFFRASHWVSVIIDRRD